MRATGRRMLLGGMVLVGGLVVIPAQSQATPPAGLVAVAIAPGAFVDRTGVKFTQGRHRVYKAKNASQVVVQELPALATGPSDDVPVDT
jgi:hypothetical protein